MPILSVYAVEESAGASFADALRESIGISVELLPCQRGSKGQEKSEGEISGPTMALRGSMVGPSMVGSLFSAPSEGKERERPPATRSSVELRPSDGGDCWDVLPLSIAIQAAELSVLNNLFL